MVISVKYLSMHEAWVTAELRTPRSRCYLAQPITSSLSQGTSRAELHSSPRSDNNKTLRKHTIKYWTQHQFLLITALSATWLFKQLMQMLMSPYLHIYFFLCWNVIDYYILQWWMLLMMCS